MIPLIALYDEYIEWPKLTEQKIPFEYIVPPSTTVGRNKKLVNEHKGTFEAIFIQAVFGSKMCNKN